MLPVSIISTASILPAKAISNIDLVELLIAGAHTKQLFNPEAEKRARERAHMIEQKTGLVSRRFFESTDNPVDVGLDILNRLMSDQDWSQLDAVIVSSSSTQGFPGLSQQIVAKARTHNPHLGNPFVLDIGSNACTGFMYAITIGQSLVQAMKFRKVALIAIEFSSRCIPYDPAAFGISTLFGDAAAGFLLSSGEAGIGSILTSRSSSMVDEESMSFVKGSGLLASELDAEIAHNSRWYMAGPPVAIGASKILIDEIQSYQNSGNQIDWLIPHQANLTRILLPACKSLNIDVSKLCSSFAETGNTSSASVPYLFDQLAQAKSFQSGDKALLIGFGASFSIGSALIQFH
jgi:3-oxoacyl-[acyl-carrier-protein] synthase III